MNTFEVLGTLAVHGFLCWEKKICRIGEIINVKKRARTLLTPATTLN